MSEGALFMNEKKILSALCYFSVFFAPFLFPIVVYFVVGPEVKRHAKKALWSHLIPLVVLCAGLITTVILGINGWEHFAVSLIVMYALFAILALIVVIWNIVKGIQVITEDHELTD